MQTFMPWPEFDWSARCLNDRELGALRVDILKVMEALLHGGTGWDEHPAVLMWDGHERALLAYQQAVCCEWSSVRGYEDEYWDKTRLMFLDIVIDPMATPLIPPIWVGNEDFHISQQSALLRIDEDHYRRYFPGIKTDHPYIWPDQ